MKNKKIITAVVLLCMIMQGLWGCEKQDLPSEQAIYIGVTYYDQSDTFLNELLDCFKKEIRKLESQDKKVTMTIQLSLIHI